MEENDGVGAGMGMDGKLPFALGVWVDIGQGSLDAGVGVTSDCKLCGLAEPATEK